MYGTIARVKVKKDSVAALIALGKEWDERERVRAKGYIGSEILWQDAGEGRACLITRFATKDDYWKNARSPEQDAFYQKMRACLEEDPEWIDGTFNQWDTPFGTVPAWTESAKG
jgi:antibiotic biosynthesis monooxygenase (ABM) superfamily enzyme